MAYPESLREFAGVPVRAGPVMRAEVLLWATRGVGLAGGAALIVGLLLLIIQASGVLLLVFVAVLLASALEPIIGWIRARLPLGRGPTILVVYALFVLVVATAVILLLPAAIRQFEDLSSSLPDLLQRARGWAAGLRPAALASGLTEVVDAAAAQLGPSQGPAPGAVVTAGLTVVEAVVSLVTVLALVFFWLVEHARLQRYALSFVPVRRRSGWHEAWNEIETRLGLWVRGQLTLMAAIAIATGIAYSILGLPSAVLLALFAGIAEAIPLVGPALGAVPAVVVALTVSPELALLVASIYVVLQFVEGNVLVPMVMRNTIGLSPFIVIVSILVGGAAGGIVGAFIAVPAAAAIEVVLERLQARDVPIAQEPSTDGSSRADDEARRQTLPDSAASSAAR